MPKLTRVITEAGGAFYAHRHDLFFFPGEYDFFEQGFSPLEWSKDGERLFFEIEEVDEDENAMEGLATDEASSDAMSEEGNTEQEEGNTESVQVGPRAIDRAVCRWSLYDVWHWKDEYLQSQQMSQCTEERTDDLSGRVKLVDEQACRAIG